MNANHLWNRHCHWLYVLVCFFFFFFSSAQFISGLSIKQCPHCSGFILYAKSPLSVTTKLICKHSVMTEFFQQIVDFFFRFSSIFPLLFYIHFQMEKKSFRQNHFDVINSIKCQNDIFKLQFRRKKMAHFNGNGNWNE